MESKYIYKVFSPQQITSQDSHFIIVEAYRLVSKDGHVYAESFQEQWEVMRRYDSGIIYARRERTSN